MKQRQRPVYRNSQAGQHNGPPQKFDNNVIIETPNHAKIPSLDRQTVYAIEGKYLYVRSSNPNYRGHLLYKFDKNLNYLGRVKSTIQSFTMADLKMLPLKWSMAGRHNHIEKVIRHLWHNDGMLLYVWDTYFIIEYAESYYYSSKHVYYDVRDDEFYDCYSRRESRVQKLSDAEGWMKSDANFKRKDHPKFMSIICAPVMPGQPTVIPIRQLSDDRTIAEYNIFVKDLVMTIERTMAKHRKYDLLSSRWDHDVIIKCDQTD